MTRPAVHLLFGMPRSGTTFLARALETLPGVAVFGESDFFGRSYVRPGDDGLYDRRALAAVVAKQSTKEWSDTTGDRHHPLARIPGGTYPQLVADALGELAHATPRAAFDAIAAAVARHTRCATVIEKTPGHLLFVDRVATALPDVRCVASWREPSGFVRSFLGLDQRAPKAMVRMLGRLSRHTAVGVLMWRSYMRALQRARTCLGSRLMVLDYEQLRVDPTRTVARAAAHFDLPEPTTDLGGLPRNATAQPGDAAPTDLKLWLRLLANDVERGAVARAALPPTSPARALRSVTTVIPASVLFAARVLPQVEGPLAYLRGYLGRGGAQ